MIMHHNATECGHVIPVYLHIHALMRSHTGECASVLCAHSEEDKSIRRCARKRTRPTHGSKTQSTSDIGEQGQQRDQYAKTGYHGLERCHEKKPTSIASEPKQLRIRFQLGLGAQYDAYRISH